jgi:hypothetical protein
VKLQLATPDLQTRVENRKRQLIDEILDHKKNSSRFGAAEEIDKLKVRLTQLTQIMKDGWTNLDPRTRGQLDAWVAR